MKRLIVMKLALKVLIICAPVYLLSGCAYRSTMYAGSELPQNQIAVLKGDVLIDVKEVDGVVKNFTPATFKGPLAYGGFEIYLLPGPHSVRIAYSIFSFGHGKTTQVWSVRDVVLTFDAIAGKVYWIYSGRMGNTWRPYIGDITNKADECKRSCP